MVFRDGRLPACTSAQADNVAVIVDVDMAIGRQTAQARHGHDGARQGIDEAAPRRVSPPRWGTSKSVGTPFLAGSWLMESGVFGHADGQVILALCRELASCWRALSERVMPRPP